MERKLLVESGLYRRKFDKVSSTPLVLHARPNETKLAASVSGAERRIRGKREREREESEFAMNRQEEEVKGKGVEWTVERKSDFLTCNESFSSTFHFVSRTVSLALSSWRHSKAHNDLTFRAAQAGTACEFPETLFSKTTTSRITDFLNARKILQFCYLPPL